jgi:hypothetical protein
MNLKWGDLSYFHLFITLITKKKSYVLHAYPNLTNFLIFKFLYNKEKDIPLVGLKTQTPYLLEAWAKGS